MTLVHLRVRQHLVDLPVNDVVDELAAVLATSTTALLVAQPGAGKTTFVPLYLLRQPWLGDNKIVMLEPRRLATRAAAHRMSELLGETVGQTIGYQTRDERRIGPNTRIEVVTEGVLTRRLQNDPTLSGVGLVIFDEIHERNLPTDLGIAFTLDTMKLLRPDLRLLAMSATAEAEVLSKTLVNANGQPAPVIESLGRQFPVEIIWDPKSQKERVEPAITRTILRALRETNGDILAFLPGIGEITRTQSLLLDQLRGTTQANVRVLRLAGALPQNEQDTALRRDPSGMRRVILATDIAETSLTVAGVSVVVDAGLARVPRFDTRTGLTRLTTIAAARANAEQRSGRAGRTEPGTAYRLWSKIEHGTRRAHLPPEISEAELTSLFLDVCIWGTPVEQLSFPDPPASSALKQARELLYSLGAIDSKNSPTKLGLAIAGLPVHPRLATMVVRASESSLDDAWAACLLATLVDERDIFRSRNDTTPTDLNLRLDILQGISRHDDVDTHAVARIVDRARDLAHRASISSSASIADHCAGRLLLYAFPDRLATKRGGIGQFQLRGGTSAWLSKNDHLADEPFIVAVDLDGDRKNARIRLAAALSIDDIAGVLDDRVSRTYEIVFDKDKSDIVMREEVRLDNMRISSSTTRPMPSDETLAAILSRIRSTKLVALKPSEDFKRLQRRMNYLCMTDPDTWPDWSDTKLTATLEQWLAPYLQQCRDLADVCAVDLTMVLQAGLSWDQLQQLTELAPINFKLPNGRVRKLEYPADSNPVLRVRVQDLYGVNIHPAIVNGAIPLVLELLSPADRPIQKTSDLPRFWVGSWKEVRKEMAGRYPKHFWPEDPATEQPPT